MSEVNIESVNGLRCQCGGVSRGMVEPGSSMARIGCTECFREIRLPHRLLQLGKEAWQLMAGELPQYVRQVISVPDLIWVEKDLEYLAHLEKWPDLTLFLLTKGKKGVWILKGAFIPDKEEGAEFEDLEDAKDAADEYVWGFLKDRCEPLMDIYLEFSVASKS